MHLDSEVSPLRHQVLTACERWVAVVLRSCPLVYINKRYISAPVRSPSLARIISSQRRLSTTEHLNLCTTTFLPDCQGLLAAMEQQRKQQRGKLQRVLGEQKARLYIIRRCVVMLLCWSD